MAPDSRRKFLILGLLIAAVLLAAKYLLPLLLPFLLGVGLALAAEPLVSFLSRSWRLPRGVCAGLGVTAALILLSALLALLGALAVRELGRLAGALPDIQSTALQGISLLRDWLVGLTQSAPDGIQPLLTDGVLRLFGDGSAVLDRALTYVPGMAKGVLSAIPGGAVSIGTGLLSAYMISARLPRIKDGLRRRLHWQEKYLPALKKLRKNLGLWLRAQSMLALVTFCIITLGLLLLRIPHAPLVGLIIALVDAVPLLGTGTVLVPWAVIQLVSRQYTTALGLFILYAAAALTRTVLEPRMVGKELGLDPLITLVALYIGFRLWGILGMITAPLLATAVKEFLSVGIGSPVLDNGKNLG